MTGLEPTVFDFITDVSVEIDHAEDGLEGHLKISSSVILFGEAFFDQFFDALGHDIAGFSSAAQRRAVHFVEHLPPLGASEASVRRLVVVFEEF